MPRITFISLLVICATFTLGAAEDRISARIDPDQTVVLKGHVHPKAQPQFDRGPVDPAMALRYVTLLLKPAPGLEDFLAGQRNPASPTYHRWLTPEQFGDRFGLSGKDTAAVSTWLKSQGLQVNDVARGRHWITFSGSAATVGHALHTSIHRFEIDGQTHFANATDPLIPAALQDVIAGFDGLHDFVPQPARNGPPVTPDFNSNGFHYLAPDDLATIYNIAPLYAAGINGAGQNIAVIGRTDVDVNDIRLFRNRFKLPAKDPQFVLFGPDPGTSSADLVEADSDIEWSGAIAPNANIIYVYSANIFTSAQYAIDQNLAPVMTFSYVACELESSNAMRGVAQQANAQGITWFASSGDSGAAQCDRNSPIPQATKGPTVSAPASFPEITAVGGTAFDDGTGAGYWAAGNNANGGSALSYIPERAWNDSALSNSLEATGGGASGYYAKPSWQKGTGVPNDGARDVPDISLPASPNHYGYLVYNRGSLLAYGGTSLSSPSFAGLAALLNQHIAAANPGSQPGLGNINPVLYRMAQSTSDVFHDVTAGDNKVPCQQDSPECVAGVVGFSAGQGYDLTTGLGSVNAYNLVMEWNKGPTSTTTLTASPKNANPDDTVTLSAAVTGSGSSTAPTGTITFLANDTTLATVPLTASGSTAAATASVSASLITFGNGVVTALYSGDDTFYPSSGTATVTLNLPATGALVIPFVSPNPVYVTPSTARWTYTVSLTEKAGAGATLTGFTISGNNDLSLFPTTKIPANGTISAGIASSGLTPPVNRPFVFTGTDATGQSWTRQLTVPFLGQLGAVLSPAMALTSPAQTVQRNPQADPSCQWSHPLILQEQGGFATTLSTLTIGGADASSQLQQLFGTLRLAPYGMLQATVCYPSATAPGTKAYVVTGVSEIGIVVTASLSVTLAPAATSAVSFSASPQTITIPVSGTSQSGAAPLNISFAGGAPQWTASLSPANRTGSWLTVSPLSGSGNAQLNLQASASGLSNGVYNAIVSVQATGAIPQILNVPVTFVVGQSSSTSIAGLQNAFSFQSVFAPGMAMSVYGTKLAPATTVAPASQFPLPLTLSGTSATVNGISAPLYYVSPGQINIQVPYETSAGQAVLAVNNNGEVAAFPFQVAVTAPGLYATAIDNSTGQPVTTAPQGRLLLLFITGEGDVTPSLATGATPSASITDPAQLPHARLPIAVTVGGGPATVLFAGVPSGVAGLTQIDFLAPANAPLGPQPVVVTVGSVASQAITLNVTQTSQ